MTSRTLKIALAVSVALNLFAVAGGAAYLVSRDRVERRIEDQRKPGREGPLAEVLQGLEPATRDRVRTALRQSALAARPDFEAARDARRQAIAAAGEPALDAARVEALLDQSRAAEMRGRARLETGAVEVLATLDADDRKALTPILQRKGDARRIIVQKDGGHGPQGESQDRPRQEPSSR